MLVIIYQNQWLTVVNMGMKFMLPSKVRNFLNNSGVFNFSRHLKTDIFKHIVKHIKSLSSLNFAGELLKCSVSSQYVCCQREPNTVTFMKTNPIT